jgi:transposase
MNIRGFETSSLVKNGLSPAKVAEDFSVYSSMIYRWIKRAEKEGLLSLKCKYCRRNEAFTTEFIAEVQKKILKPSSSICHPR